MTTLEANANLFGDLRSAFEWQAAMLSKARTAATSAPLAVKWVARAAIFFQACYQLAL